jgi:hypothetical protein
MTRHAWACALSAACVLAGVLNSARSEVLDGVQPAALDQPQINMVIYLGDNTVPQIGVTPDPLREIFGDLFPDDFYNDVRFFNVQAYLDTGASGILVSASTAAALGIVTEQVNGVPVIYSDVGVAGRDDFSVSVPLRMALASYLPGADTDQFADSDQTIPITTSYTPVPAPASGVLRAQVGPYVPTVDSTTMDEYDQLIQELAGGASALEVAGMPVMKGRVMVVDPSGVKNLGQLFSVLSDVLAGTTADLTDEQYAQLETSGVKTYLYDRSTAPAFDANRTNNPGIPAAQRHVALSYASFDRFTQVTVGPGGAAQEGLPAPTLEHNPFIGKNPVALLEGLPAGDAPGITIARVLDGGLTLRTEGNWLLDTGAAASIISEGQAAALHVKYDRENGHGPGAPSEDPEAAAPAPNLIDSITGETVANQFTLTLGGIGGQTVLAGFWLDSLLLPTKEATASGDDALNIYFTHVPVLVGDITVADPLDATKTVTLDGIFGMNMLIESINFQMDSSGGLSDIGAPSPSFFQWITFDEPNAELGLVFDPEAVAAVPEPGTLALLGAGMVALAMRRRRGPSHWRLSWCFRGS